jgi:hypothetical protein
VNETLPAADPSIAKQEARKPQPKTTRRKSRIKARQTVNETLPTTDHSIANKKPANPSLKLHDESRESMQDRR